MNGRQWVTALVGLVGAAACQRTPQAAPPVATEVRPTASASPAEPWRAFQPPADGRLTAAQVEMYVAVRRQAVPSPQAPLDAGQLVEVAVAERRAVSQQGHDAEEYRWVSARIAEASRPDTEALGSMAGAIEAAGRKGREQVLDQAARKHVPVTPTEPATDDAALAYNRELLGRYRRELDGLRSGALPAPASPPAS